MLIRRHLIQYLQTRELVAQVTDEQGLSEQLSKNPISLYCGFDPTHDSLHVGHLVPLLCLKHFQLAGHRPVALIGGATALIGDPSFKKIERKLNTGDTIQVWIQKIKNQVSRFLDFDCGHNSAMIVNNYDWFYSMNILTFFRDIGKKISVNKMIHKESVKQRLHRDNSGISFAEFSYPLFQSYDFTYLNNQYGVMLQIGGTDQWGNIISGIDLTRCISRKTVYGLTVPLMAKSDGTKFGKTEKDTIWLDGTKTSPYKFYQFWINTADSDVYHFLKCLTFMKLSEINEIKSNDDCSGRTTHRSRRKAQYILAEEVTRMVHGTHGLDAARRASEILFADTTTMTSSCLTEKDFAQLVQDGMPMVILEIGVDLQQALVEAALAPSRGQARKMITSNAIMVNGKIQSSAEYTFRDTDRLSGYTLLRRGKKHHCLVHWK